MAYVASSWKPEQFVRRTLKLVFALLLLVSLAPPSAAATDDVPPTTLAAVDAGISATKQAMMANPRAALGLARRAQALASRLPDLTARLTASASARWLEGEALIYLNDPDAARAIISRALADVEAAAPATKLHGDLLRSRGSIAAMHGDVLSALNDYQRAHDVFRVARILRSQAITLQDIGMIYSDAGDYERALAYYAQAEEVFSGEAAFTLTMHNNRAEVLRRLQRYDEASSEHRAALDDARKVGSAVLETRILTNLAADQAQAGHLASAQATIDQAMILSARGEAAGWKPFVYGIAANIAADRGDNARAAQLFETTFSGVDLATSDMVFRDYHRVASQVFEAMGDDSSALAHLHAYQRLDSEARSLTASTASQLLGARFDFANQNLRIARLKEDQLKRGIELERDKRWFWSVIFAGLITAGAAMFAIVISWLFSVRRVRDRIHTVNTSLTVANVALEQAVKAKTEFLSTTSHEIRTPLNGILGMTQVMLADRHIGPAMRERVGIVHAAGETMRALVDDILDVAKMESGELVLSYEPTDVGEIARSTVQLWSGRAETKNVSLDLDLVDIPASIAADRARLRQIIFNLMSNAIKFTAHGSVTLRIGVEAADDGEQLVIAISDTGIGIEAEKFEEIFESFKQVDSGIARQYGGTGLGLAICRRLVDAMDGTIKVASVVGSGTTFTVRLPLTRVAPAKGAVPIVHETGALASASMLLVVPQTAHTMMLRMLLLPEVKSLDLSSGLNGALSRIDEGTVTHLVFDLDCLSNDEDPIIAAQELIEAATRRVILVTLLTRAPLIIPQVMGVGVQIIIKPIIGSHLLDALHLLYHSDMPSADHHLLHGA